jgi:hypothetical protein
VRIYKGATGIHPSGSVRVYRGSKVLATRALRNGGSVVVLPRLSVGKHKLRVVYVGSTNVRSSGSSYFYLTVVK